MRHAFRIVAIADPQALPRITGIFAQRSLVPIRMSADCRGGKLHVEAVLDDLSSSTAAVLAAKLAEAVLVASARCDRVKPSRDPRRKTAPRALAAA